MKTAYFDCFAGASGDMILGALLDAGLRLTVLNAELGKLDLPSFDLSVAKVVRHGLAGSQARVMVREEKHHRSLSQIKEIINRSDLAPTIKEMSLAVFTRLAEAEAKVHQTDIERIHFHEVGAMDAIVDVVGAAIGLHALGIERIFCSALHVGTGTVTCAHGVLPVPAPATAELVRGRPIYSTGVVGELLTPTGAAILTTLASGFGECPAMTVEAIGYGAGTIERHIPNLLRVIVGQAPDEVTGPDRDRVAVIDANIDDMNPQVYDHLMTHLLDSGALDVFLTPVQMKKNRPAVLLTVIGQTDHLAKLADIIIRETTTIGLRWRIDHRFKAQRTVREISTVYGPVKVKVARFGSEVVNVSPEYDDLKRLAVEKRLPLKKLMAEVQTMIVGIELPE